MRAINFTSLSLKNEAIRKEFPLLPSTSYPLLVTVTTLYTFFLLCTTDEYQCFDLKPILPLVYQIPCPLFYSRAFFQQFSSASLIASSLLHHFISIQACYYFSLLKKRKTLVLVSSTN
jgi:hypothetical protein